MKKYVLKSGRVSIGGVKPDTIGDELGRIYERDGELTAPVVVKEATPKNAPLHPAFEWDNAKAANGFREHQARTLIKSVRITVPDAPEVQVQAYEFVPSAVPSQPGAYHSHEVIISRPDLYALAVKDLHLRVMAAEAALANLTRLSENITDTDKLTRISIAMQAMQTASAAVMALH